MSVTVSTASAWPRVRQLAPAALLMVMTLLTYLPALNCGYIWDDDYYVTQNRTVLESGGFWRIWFEPGSSPQYYPLVQTTYWVEHRLWGLVPVGFHLTNILLHGLGAVLLWRVLVRLNVPGAWPIAAVFALHPVHVESVAWITERKNVLSGAFYFGSLLTYLRFRPLNSSAISLDGPKWLYLLSIVLFLGALLSKTVTASLPAVILVIVWWKCGRVRWRDVLPLLPMFALGIALALHTVYLERHNVGAQGPQWDFTLLERWLIAGRAVWFYLGKLVWPNPLVFIYPRWQIDSAIWWQYLFPLTSMAVVVLLWFVRAPVGRGPLAAVLLFGGTLVPALGFFNVYPMRYTFVADHYQYLASAPMIALLVAAGANCLSRIKKPIDSPWLAVGLVVIMLLPLAGLSWRQQSDYRNEEVLWRHTIQKNPSAWMAHFNLGLIHFRRGDLAQAKIHYDDALRVKSDMPEGYFNRGNVFSRLGQYDLALKEYTRSLAIRPDYVQAYVNRGITRHKLREYQLALADYSKGIELAPENSTAYHNRGNTYKSLGMNDAAFQDYATAIRLDPNFVLSYAMRGHLYERIGNWQRALEDYSRAIELKPNEARVFNNRGNVYRKLGMYQPALADYERAIDLRPDHAKAHDDLAWLLATCTDARFRDGKESVSHASRACELLGWNDFGILETLAAAHAEAGSFAEAVRWQKKAVELAPVDAKTELNSRLELYQSGRPYREGAQR